MNLMNPPINNLSMNLHWKMSSPSHQTEVTTPHYEFQRTTTVVFYDLPAFPAIARPSNVCNLLHTSLCQYTLSEILVHLQGILSLHIISPSFQSESPGLNWRKRSTSQCNPRNLGFLRWTAIQTIIKLSFNFQWALIKSGDNFMLIFFACFGIISTTEQ